MAILAKKAHLAPWWDEAQIKKLWRAYHLDKTKPLSPIAQKSPCRPKKGYYG
jgi:hypothetical protein